MSRRSPPTPIPWVRSEWTRWDQVPFPMVYINECGPQGLNMSSLRCIVAGSYERG